MSKAWVVAVSMGYGHQRTAFPLRDLSPDKKIVNANDYEGIPREDKDIWASTSHFYEFISRFKRVPVIGTAVFYLYDRFQKIFNFYPRRDLSRPNETLKQAFRLIRDGWGKDLIERLSKGKMPLITTFFTTAFMAEEWKYPGDIYCVTADADIARGWAPLDPKNTKIQYCASTDRVFERLKLYGVRAENIHLTGYPLPKENIGGQDMEILREDMRPRLVNLDPSGRYTSEYGPVIKANFGSLPKSSGRPLTIMFSIGGAGAQKEIGIAIVKSLRDDIRAKKVKVILSAGTRRETVNYFTNELKNLGFKEPFNDGAEILWAIGLHDYFEKFDETLRVTDILWTKPSELSFYCALGLPIVIAPPIGSQEDFNREWLLKVGAGLDQYDPIYTHEWLADYLKDGWFAEAAMHGFLEAEKMGAYNIDKLVTRTK
ncbi:MAG: hypothetical protein M1361_01485 [Patescibacteria group bacterium]|nr:hypothetical protein [Patescibacteria group bacterium]MCL5224269.1 hypothetical protein [Patescibacteria group bacterium]